MPRQMTLEPNPQYVPKGKDAAETAALKAAFETVKARGRVTVAYAQAMENIRLSGGMYVPIVQEDAEIVTTIRPRTVDDWSNDELKTFLINAGLTLEKRVKRADLIMLVQRKLDEVEVADDEGTTPE